MQIAKGKLTRQAFTEYEDARGLIFFVFDNAGCGSAWATFSLDNNGTIKRVHSKYLPWQGSKRLAQNNLDSYAQRHKLLPVPHTGR